MTYATAKALFFRLCDLPHDEQNRQLDALGGGEAQEALRREVHAMLAADNAAAATASSDGIAPALPSRIGPFDIIRKLGEGGMGVVYLAEQRDGLQRTVALKQIRHGFVPEQVLQRFGVEQAALARMDHPCIARVLEAAVDAAGAPYFVMEYIDGGHIEEVCDRRRLDVDARVALMVQVCRGVHHAHQKGILHRDLKPGNVLVSDVDGHPQPKIIDFGIARSLDRDQNEAIDVTHAGQLLGTPSFMSPEQLTPDAAQDVDTRTDQYALGVMLYRLVTGSLPYRTDTSRVSLDEVVRAIRTERPVGPGLRVSARNPDDIAAAFGQPATAVRNRVNGDLAWILEKVLEKDRERRYPSVADFADDLQRFLDGHAVVARKPTLAYRLRCFAKRQRLLAASILIVCVSLLAGAATTVWQLTRAVRAEREATLFAERAERENDRFRLARHTLDIEDATREAADMRSDSDDGTVCWTSQIAQIEAWIRDRAVALEPAATEVESAIAELMAKSGASSPKVDHSLAPSVDHEAPAIDIARARVRSEERIHALATKSETLTIPTQLGPLDTLDAAHLRQAAMIRVGPPRERWIWGSEALGLLAARTLLERLGKQKGSAEEIAKSPPATSTPLHRAALETAAWAEFTNGNIDAARAIMRAGRQHYPQHPALNTLFDDVETRCVEIETGGRDTLRTLALALRRLEADAALEEPRPGLDSSDRFLLRALLHFRRRLIDFDEPVHGTRAIVIRRLVWARALRDGLSADHPHAATTWREARNAIARADGAVASTLYREVPIDLRPQEGLVPLGMNPATKLWEFYHLRSAWDPQRGLSPRDIEIPRHDADTGNVAVTPSTGIVFVLVPGGRFLMGAQADDPTEQNYDPEALPREQPPQQVRLAPFFLARHEMTQGQWRRLSETGDQPSTYETGFVNDSMPAGVDATHPVDSVSWNACSTLLRRHGLHLPTESQWECAARAGTSAAYGSSSSPASLRARANGLGQETNRLAWPGARAAWSDGYQIHAPVGSFAATRWGFFDLQGNVYEWCRDRFGVYDVRARVGDGFRDSSRRDGRVQRGGCFIQDFGLMRVSARSSVQPSIATPEIGVRASRRLHP